MSLQSAAKLASRPSREEILSRLPEIAADIAKGAAKRELDRELPFEVFRKLRLTGLTYLRVPTVLGGPGGSLSDQVEVTCALAAADSNVAHALRGHFGFLESMALDPHSPSSQQYAGEVLNGKLFGGAHMEINTPRPNMIRTRLVKAGDKFRLTGKKYYATGAAYSDYTSFSALDEEGELTGVLVPADRKGVDILDDWDGMGQRLTASGGVDLNDVEILPEEVGARRGFGGGNPFMRRHQATRAQLHLAAVICGIVRNVQSDAISYVQTKARSAKHSASETARGDHFVQNVVGEISAASYTIDTLISDTARILDVAAAGILAGAPNLDELVLRGQLANSKAQIMIGKLAVRAAEQIFDTGGGSATSRKYNYDRHWRNIRTILNHNPLLLKGRVIGDYYLNGVRDDFDEGRVF
ncbi:MAG: acyl-CoA dehydrogenase [Parvibaculaceae bacterium]|nr:acyl-CoA dehydrogenase [Parvibaculaceae bacterium]